MLVANLVLKIHGARALYFRGIVNEREKIKHIIHDNIEENEER